MGGNWAAEYSPDDKVRWGVGAEWADESKARSLSIGLFSSPTGLLLPATASAWLGESFEGDAAILAVPLSALQAKAGSGSGGIRFTPQLPDWKTWVICRLGSGTRVQLHLSFAQCFWEPGHSVAGLQPPAQPEQPSPQQQQAGGLFWRFDSWPSVVGGEGGSTEEQPPPLLVAHVGGSALHEVCVGGGEGHMPGRPGGVCIRHSFSLADPPPLTCCVVMIPASPSMHTHLECMPEGQGGPLTPLSTHHSMPSHLKLSMPPPLHLFPEPPPPHIPTPHTHSHAHTYAHTHTHARTYTHTRTEGPPPSLPCIVCGGLGPL